MTKNENKTIVRIKYGSHLYGTETAASDTDYKGVFLPTKKQIFLGSIPKSYNNAKKKIRGQKNTAGDVDLEVYSLHYFIKLACEGQTVALDMLHAPRDMILESSDTWESIIANREKFYTKNLSAFVGYARKQAAKYGIRGSRLNAAQVLINLLLKCEQNEKLTTVWELLPVGEHMQFIENSINGIRQYQICGKIIQETQKVDYTLRIFKKFYLDYGHRAKEAARNKNIDWKAVSHALRAAYQVKQLLTENTIAFPLKEASFLKEVKQGNLRYVKEVAPKLELLMDEVEALSQKSKLPEKVDRIFWDSFIMGVIEREYANGSF